MSDSSCRAHWNRICSLALFVEHVLLGTQIRVPELSQLVTQYVTQLSKVSPNSA